MATRKKANESKSKPKSITKSNIIELLKTKPKPKLSVPVPPPPLDLPKLDFQEKGKGKRTSTPRAVDETLWVDSFQPQTDEELAVHNKKVDVVRRWLTDAFNGASSQRKFRKILALTGPAGSGKTATLQVIARELKLDILEWKNSADDRFGNDDYESLSHKFQDFMSNASGTKSLNMAGPTSSSKPRQVILLEDLPNLLYGPTLESFHDTLNKHVNDPRSAPIILIISGTGIRGEGKDQNPWSGKPEVMDIRTVLPSELLQSAFVTHITFNPIAQTLMRAALKNLIDNHLAVGKVKGPSKEVLDAIIETSNGDIRGAIMALQFSSTLTSGKVKKGATTLQVITKREQVLALFHLLGKVLYNKRVGDPPSESKSKKEQERELALDALVPIPPPLPPHLMEFERRGSRVDTNTLYADSPIDTSLFSLYLHQNYTQFCNEVDECHGIADLLSAIDATSDSWEGRAQVMAERFQTLSLGTLLSLPSPVPRLHQRMLKPEYFDYLRKHHQAEEAVADARELLSSDGRFDWSPQSIPLLLSIITRHTNEIGTSTLPSNHSLFSSLTWNGPSFGRATELDDDDDGLGDDALVSNLEPPVRTNPKSVGKTAPKRDFWLDEDNIEEF